MKRSIIRQNLISLIAVAACGCSAEGPVEGPEELSDLRQEWGECDDDGWPMAGHNARATGTGEDDKIDRYNVGGLEVKWTFNAQSAGHPIGPVHSMPILGGGKIFFGTTFGQLIAIDTDGNLLWEKMTRPATPLLAAVFGAQFAPVIGAAALPANSNLVIFGDLDGYVYALDRDTGAEVWAREVNTHPLGGVVGNSILTFGSTVVVGMASVENYALGIPGYPCCTHGGFVAALDVATGADKWRYYTMGPPQPLNGAFGPNFAYGPSGADIWGQPSYDERSNTVYFGTGQNFTPKLSATPPFTTDTSDAIIAVDATTGALKWKRQITSGDIWVSGFPNPNTINPDTGLPQIPFAKPGFLDLDFGDSPKIYRLPDGRKVVGAGQKSGEYHVLDAATGQVIASTMHIGMANSLGGFQMGGAVGSGMAFGHGQRALDQTGAGPFLGSVVGMSLDGTQLRWEFNQLLSPIVGPMATSNGVVYAVSPAEDLAYFDPTRPQEWALYAFNSSTGQVLLRQAFPGRAMAGIAIADGRVYTGMGNTALEGLGLDMNGGIVALGRPGDDH